MAILARDEDMITPYRVAPIPFALTRYEFTLLMCHSFPSLCNVLRAFQINICMCSDPLVSGAERFSEPVGITFEENTR